MGKTVTKLLSALTALTLALTALSPALAANYLTIQKPAAQSVWYKGENIPVKVKSRDPGKGYRAVTVYYLRRKGSDLPVWVNADPAAGHTWTGNIKTSLLLPAGKYTLTAALGGVPVEALAADPGLLPDLSDPAKLDPAKLTALLAALRSLPLTDTAEQTVTLKLLQEPTKLKAKAGKKKITVSWKKAAGATQYEVYRSAKQTSGYQKVAATKKTGYTDKAVKRGKAYYYKVKSVRAKYGTIRSIYTRVAASGKVK
jgi:hypothetical protein